MSFSEIALGAVLLGGVAGALRLWRPVRSPLVPAGKPVPAAPAAGATPGAVLNVTAAAGATAAPATTVTYPGVAGFAVLSTTPATATSGPKALVTWQPPDPSTVPAGATYVGTNVFQLVNGSWQLIYGGADAPYSIGLMAPGTAGVAPMFRLANGWIQRGTISQTQIG